ncbi:hypothetical protein CY35_03G122100 [Sphagnum magellanicum]|nr:hypothetical protein CY35_03G122100 [Sphagnum magellanicum]
MGAGMSFMSANVATPPTSEWQALASSFASDSATLMSRLLLLFIFITIAACGLHLHIRKRLSGSDDGTTGEEPSEDIEMNDLHSAEGPSSFTDAVVASILSAANTVDAVSIAMNASS